MLGACWFTVSKQLQSGQLTGKLLSDVVRKFYLSHSLNWSWWIISKWCSVTVTWNHKMPFALKVGGTRIQRTLLKWYWTMWVLGSQYAVLSFQSWARLQRSSCEELNWLWSWNIQLCETADSLPISKLRSDLRQSISRFSRELILERQVCYDWQQSIALVQLLNSNFVEMMIE